MMIDIASKLLVRLIIESLRYIFNLIQESLAMGLNYKHMT